MLKESNIHQQIRAYLTEQRTCLARENTEIAAKIARNRSSTGADLADQADQASSNELCLLHYERNKKTLEHIITALKDMDNASYGTCKLCGEPIGIKRLQAMPCAKYCIHCQESMDYGASMHVTSRHHMPAGLRF
jgi:DnaK suppressor protein